MRPLELISEMCDIINTLSDIVKRQQTEIERSKSRSRSRKNSEAWSQRQRERWM